ncbi:Uncharacterized protein BP5553_08159 [Venustampulla echinocandica]|uniref:Uncharacterized protein n=1 Tax=Venustampulla echinocandica TaxID=2656787 RepID=A0A370TFY3_9HELO|nr:Uncharacterized protein BP5553_08159 [Venustampulla echinocandica]RDL33791.1 Uncharacterized protein BP5553_08159 [Venustampulla echinocandica]
MLSLLSLVLLALPTSFAAPLSGRTDPVIRQVYTFGPNRFIENIAVRSNSKLLVTSMSVPDLFSINPTLTSPTAPIVYTFPNASGLSGITETSPDVFAVVSGVWDLATTRANLGSLSVWTVNFCGSSPVVSHVASIANSTILNGITTVPGSPHLVLAADSDIGAVWKVNTLTGAYSIAFSDPLFLPTGTAPGTNLGINGLKAKGSYLYFTNSALGIYGRVGINSLGNKVGSVQTLASMPVVGGHYDDLDIDASGNTWIATHPSHVVKVKSDGTQKVLANTALLLNPTSAAFGRGNALEKRTLYVTNGGEFVGNDLVNEGIVSFDTAGF